jgi:hypothetical protein
MLSRGAVESLPEFLWRIVMKLPEFNLFSDKSARIFLIFPNQGFFQDFLLGPFLQTRLSLAEQLGVWGGCLPPPPYRRLKPVPTLV